LISSFVKGEVQVLCNCEVLTTGFDDPSITDVFIARATVSKVLYEQMIGRGIRGKAFGGTEKCTVHFCEDNYPSEADLPLVIWSEVLKQWDEPIDLTLYTNNSIQPVVTEKSSTNSESKEERKNRLISEDEYNSLSEVVNLVGLDQFSKMSTFSCYSWNGQKNICYTIGKSKKNGWKPTDKQLLYGIKSLIEASNEGLIKLSDIQNSKIEEVKKIVNKYRV
jgi:hypothetical protein